MSYQHEQLPPPPAKFFVAIKVARKRNVWVKCARRAIPGQHRYIVTVEHGSEPLFSSNDIDDVLDWLRRSP